MAQGAAQSRVLVIGSQATALTNFRGRLMADLAALGHEVAAAAPHFGSAEREALAIHGVRPVELSMRRNGMNPFTDLALMRAVLALVRAERPSLVLTSTAKPNIWGAFAAAATGVPSIAMVTGLGYAFTRPGPDAGARDRLRQRIANAAARTLYRASTGLNRRVVFQNPDDRREFIETGCLADASKAVLCDGSGVDLSLYAPAPLPAAPNVLMVSRLLGNKGVREYAGAAALVKRRRPDARFRLVGPLDDGPDGIGEREIASWSAGGLEYLGPRADVRPAIADASVCVLPSYREGTPRALLEAMAMGRPIVASDAPGCRETVEHGRNGFLVPVRDPDALADRLGALVDAPATRARMGRHSRAMAERRYDVRRVNARLIEDLGLAA